MEVAILFLMIGIGVGIYLQYRFNVIRPPKPK